MIDKIRNIFFDDEVTYRTYKGKDKVFRQNMFEHGFDLGPGSEVEVDMDKQLIVGIISVINSGCFYCNHCGKKFFDSFDCYTHSSACVERGYLRHPEGEDLDGVYKRRRRINSNNG